MDILKIAIIGQPNVGKSSLFNRIAKKKVAIVSEVSGTTRDIRKREVEIFDKKALILDSGGIEKTNDLIFSEVSKKSIQIANEADIVLYMVDGKKLPDPFDKELFYKIQKLNKPIALVINKIDNDKEEDNVWNFYEFGIDDKLIFPISVSHNRKVNHLLYWIKTYLDNVDDIIQTSNTNDDSIKVSIIGRPNVGKSSILNALLNENRSVVSPIAGTTIDPVDESTEFFNHKVTFVDTAGLRRRGKIKELEKYALMRTRDMLKQSHLAILVLDASETLKELDEKIAGLVDEYGLGVIIVLNKWDIKEEEYQKFVQEIRYRFKFLYFAPILAISATTKRNIEKLKLKIIQIYQNYTKRLSTSRLNKLINEATIKHALPATKSGKRLKIYYATQYDTSPPTFALIMNRANSLHFSYKRYLINFIREYEDFEGVPLRIVTRSKNKEAHEELVVDDKVLYQELY
jgi:GTP-binding protein